jgi:hypothetical protein
MPAWSGIKAVLPSVIILPIKAALRFISAGHKLIRHSSPKIVILARRNKVHCGHSNAMGSGSSSDLLLHHIRYYTAPKIAYESTPQLIPAWLKMPGITDAQLHRLK